MDMSPIRRLVVVALLALLAGGCTAPAGGSSTAPSQPGATVVASIEPASPDASPAASGGGSYGDGDEYATPKP